MRLTGGAGQGVWIAKASNSSKGVGIKLVERLAHAEDCRGAGRVLQKYIENPALLPGPEAGPSGSEAGPPSALPRAPGDAPGGRKFDVRCWVRPLSPPRLRAYVRPEHARHRLRAPCLSAPAPGDVQVLVTSWNPLVVWFYHDCLVRVCAHPWCRPSPTYCPPGPPLRLSPLHSAFFVRRTKRLTRASGRRTLSDVGDRFAHLSNVRPCPSPLPLVLSGHAASFTPY